MGQLSQSYLSPPASLLLLGMLAVTPAAAATFDGAVERSDCFNEYGLRRSNASRFGINNGLVASPIRHDDGIGPCRGCRRHQRDR